MQNILNNMFKIAYYLRQEYSEAKFDQTNSTIRDPSSRNLPS